MVGGRGGFSEGQFSSGAAARGAVIWGAIIQKVSIKGKLSGGNFPRGQLS